MIPTTVILGVPIDDVTIDEAVDEIARMVDVGRTTGRTHQLTTVNVDFVVNALADPDVLSTLQSSDLAVPDGAPLVWASRLARAPLRERAAGADLVPAIVARSASTGLRVCLFGGRDGIAGRAAELLKAGAPGADVIGVTGPVVAADGTMDDSALAPLVAMRPDIVCVALGNPKQERWITRYRAAIGAPVFIGIGGTLDFLTGETGRAPRWMQRAGLEWLHRALSEPRRLARRYAGDIVVFIPRVIAQLVRGRGGRGARCQPDVETDEGRLVVVRFQAPAPHTLESPFADLLVALTAEHEVVVGGDGLAGADNQTAAAAATVVRLARRAGAHVVLEGPGATLPATARRLGIDRREDVELRAR